MGKDESERDEIVVWLDELENEILELFHHKELFEFTRDEILEKNQIVKKTDGTYFGWIMRSSTIDMIIRLARLCDDRRDTKSFVRFLRELSCKGEYLSRRRFAALYVGSSVEDFADRDFDRLAGEGADYFPKHEIENDIQTLTSAEPFVSITQFRNEYVAHIGKERGRKPTYNELFSAMEHLTKLSKKYRSLLTGQKRMSDTPTIQGDWQAPLRAPLILNEGT